MHRQSAVLVGATLLVTGVLLSAQTPGQTAPRPDTERLRSPVRKVRPIRCSRQRPAIAGMAEVELGKMGMRQGSNAKIKSFGQQMVTDHTKADELKSIAKSKGMILPTALDPPHQTTREKLAKLSGAEFDRAYMDATVTGIRPSPRT
jgi:predicted outer membrane protein